MSFTVPDGYLDGPGAVHEAFRFCTREGERCPKTLRPPPGWRSGGWAIKAFAPWIVAEFANERIPAYGIQKTDGNVVTLDAGLWRKPLFIAAESGYGGSTGATRDPGLAFISRSTFDLSRSNSVLPIVAAQDLMAALGAEDLPPRPTLRPDGKADAFPPPNARAEAAHWWMLGFAEGIGEPSRMKRDWVVDRCREVTGCTVDQGRRAYSDLPEGLRNPSPTGRNAR